MISKTGRYLWIVASGVFVLALALWKSGPGIAETDSPTYHWQYMLLFALWFAGLILEIKQGTRILGTVIMALSVILLLVL